MESYFPIFASYCFYGLSPAKCGVEVIALCLYFYEANEAWP